MEVQTLKNISLHSCAMHTPLYSSGLISELPTILLEDILCRISAHELLRLEPLFNECGIDASKAWARQLNMIWRCSDNRIFLTKENSHPRQIYMDKLFQQILTYLTYSGKDPGLTFHSLPGETVPKHFCNYTTDESVLMRIALEVKSLVLINAHFTYLLNSQTLLDILYKNVTKIQILHAKDTIYDKIKIVLQNFIYYGNLRNVHFDHIDLSPSNLHDIVFICCGRLPIYSPSKEKSASQCLPNDVRLPEKNEKFHDIVDCSESCTLCVPEYSSHRQATQSVLLEAEESEQSDSEDLFNLALMPVKRTTEKLKSKDSLPMCNILGTCDGGPLDHKHANITSFVVFGCNSCWEDLELALSEMLHEWTSLKKFALVHMFSSITTNREKGLPDILVSLIQSRRLQELVIDDVVFTSKPVSMNWFLSVLSMEDNDDSNSIPLLKYLRFNDMMHATEVDPTGPAWSINDKNFAGVTHLDLGHNSIDVQDADLLVEYIEHSQCLQHLNLEECNLRPIEVRQIFCAIARTDRLVSLNVSEGLVVGPAIEGLIHMLKNSRSIRRLVMIYCRIVPHRLVEQDVIDAFTNSTLEELVISKNRLGEQVIHFLQSIVSRQLPNVTLRTIDLSYNAIREDHLLNLAEFLKRNMADRRGLPILKSLDISGNFVDWTSDTLYKTFTHSVRNVISGIIRPGLLEVGSEHLSQM